MRKFSLLIILIFYSQFNNLNSFAKNAWVDKKEVCEASGGNWRLFNNNCGDSCESKFSLPICTSILIYNCDCGNDKCLDGDKCISDKIAQRFWKEKAEEDKIKRKKELEDLKINPQVATIATKLPPDNNSKPSTTNKNNPSQPKNPPPSQNKITTTANPIKPPATILNTAETANNPALMDPTIAKIQDTQKLLCTQQKGDWKEFDNGCVDNCSSKISKISICTQAKTFGCGCGDGRCWDNTKKSCIETEEYRKSMNNQITPNSINNFLTQPKS